MKVLNVENFPEVKKMGWKRSLSPKLVAAVSDQIAQRAKAMCWRSPAWLNLLPETKKNQKTGRQELTKHFWWEMQGAGLVWGSSGSLVSMSLLLLGWLDPVGVGTTVPCLCCNAGRKKRSHRALKTC